MSEIKKLIISRKKIDQKGNEYALIKISSSLEKHPEIRVIKYKKSPKRLRQKLKTDNGFFDIKNDKTSNNYSPKKMIRTRVTDSPTAKSSKLTSFISTFNTPSKSKNSFIYNSPKPYLKPHISNIGHFKNSKQKKINNENYNSNIPNNFTTLRTNYQPYKTDFNYDGAPELIEYDKKKNTLNNKIMILSQQNKKYSAKIKNMKERESKLNNIKIQKLKDKKEVKDAKNNKRQQINVKRQILEEIKEVNKYKQEAVNVIKNKEKQIKTNNNKKESIKVKSLIKKAKKINYQKNRENYLKIRKEEEKIKKRCLKSNLNFSSTKKKDNNYSYYTKALIDKDHKDIEELKKRYEILKMINNEYSSYLKEINNTDLRRSFTPYDLRYFNRNHLSYSMIKNSPKKYFSKNNSKDNLQI